MTKSKQKKPVAPTTEAEQAKAIHDAVMAIINECCLIVDRKKLTVAGLDDLVAQYRSLLENETSGQEDNQMRAAH